MDPSAAGVKRSINCLVCAMLERLEAPNTIPSICGWRQTYSNASLGGNAPLANTDIAINRASPLAINASYAGIPPHIRKPILLMFAQIIGFTIPTFLSLATNIGAFMVMKPASAL